MPISDFHASHITKVDVAFVLSHPELDPDRVTGTIGVNPSRSARRGDPRVVGERSLSPWSEGWWRLESRAFTQSKYINDHFNAILPLLLPHCAAIGQLAEGHGETFFGILWCSTYLYAGTGPLIDASSLKGVAALGAGMGFDIDAVDDTTEEGIDGA